MLRSSIVAAIGFAVFNWSNVAFATCASDTWICEDDVLADPMPDPLPVYSHTDVCNPPPDYCPLQAVPSDDSMSVEWVTGIGQWYASTQWSTVQLSDEHPSLVHLQPNMAGAAWPGSGNENSCGLATATDVNHSLGDIVCWGNLNSEGQITSRPTGGEPYSSISVGHLGNGGSAGTYGALDSSGGIVIWGVGDNGAFDTGRPTATGFDALAIGYGQVGCAVDSSVAGVNCWGSNTQSIVSGAPSSGNYRAVGIGRYTAGAVSTTGSLSLWGATGTSATFRSNWPTISGAGVKEVFFNESGAHAGVAWMEDTDPNDGVDHNKRAVIWMYTDASNTALIQNAPCKPGVSCPATNAKWFETKVKFRTAPRMTKLDAPGSICGVVESDPDNIWQFGDVICWGHMGESTDAPLLKAVCNDPTQ